MHIFIHSHIYMYIYIYIYIQFVDGAVMLVTNPHRLSFLVAEKSFNQRIVGDFARLVGSIPVARPQDTAQKGPGTVRFEGLRLLGEGTSFTEIKR
jgi:glycerol-3-phosphate O-acyltransferase/dihydroxyacetone phosphate acyltransferase